MEGRSVFRPPASRRKWGRREAHTMIGGAFIVRPLYCGIRLTNPFQPIDRICCLVYIVRGRLLPDAFSAA